MGEEWGALAPGPAPRTSAKTSFRRKRPRRGDSHTTRRSQQDSHQPDILSFPPFYLLLLVFFKYLHVYQVIDIILALYIQPVGVFLLSHFLEMTTALNLVGIFSDKWLCTQQVISQQLTHFLVQKNLAMQSAGSALPQAGG